MFLFHSTNAAAAHEIERTRRFRRGTRGFAGGAIYFSSSSLAACRKYGRGRGNPDVVIKCKVDLGTVVEGYRNCIDERQCRVSGGDSVKIHGVDVWAVYDPERVQIVAFTDAWTGDSWSGASQRSGAPQQQLFQPVALAAATVELAAVVDICPVPPVRQPGPPQPSISVYGSDDHRGESHQQLLLGSHSAHQVQPLRSFFNYPCAQYAFWALSVAIRVAILWFQPPSITTMFSTANVPDHLSSLCVLCTALDAG